MGLFVRVRSSRQRRLSDFYFDRNFDVTLTIIFLLNFDHNLIYLINSRNISDIGLKIFIHRVTERSLLRLSADCL